MSNFFQTAGGIPTKQVFCYVRVSTEEQALHGLSIEAQTEALENWAAAHGHKVLGVYTDAGISARKPASKRPELQRLLADVQSGKGDLVIFTKLDRWFRNIAEYYKVQEILERHHVDWKTIQEDYETSTASGRLKINIMLSVAQDEADRTSERIKAVFEIKRQKREPLTGDCPTGYRIEGKRFVKHPDTQAAVERFFRTFLSTGSVSRSMEEAERCGLRISYHLAHKMLGSPTYCGLCYGVDGMTPPYITREEYDKIQSMRKRAVRKTVKNRVYLFSGLISCGDCGSRMGGRINSRRNYRYYNCTAHYMKAAPCENRVNLGERKIEAFLLDALRGKMDRLKLEAPALSPLDGARDYRGELSALRAKAKRVTRLYVGGIISFAECQADHARYAAQIEALEQEAALQKEPDLSAAEELLSGGWDAMYRDLCPEKKQMFWRMVIREIRIHPDRRIEYEWNL